MKFGVFFTLFVFLNFMALPSLAVIFDWDLASTNVIISEEEIKHLPLGVGEKSIPNTVSVHDFIKFFQSDLLAKKYLLEEEPSYTPPHLTIFNPPPEV